MEHTFDERSRLLTIKTKERYRCRFGDGEEVVHERLITARPHSIGLRIESNREGVYPYRNERSVVIVPGQYSLTEVSDYIACALHVEPVVVSDLLLETELWYDRGFLNDVKNFPPELFEKIPLNDFLHGSLKSYKRWVRDVVYTGRAFFGISADRIEKNIRDGIYPEKLHSVRHWASMKLTDLRFAIRYQAWRHPSWGVFVSQYYPMYSGVLSRHPEAWEEADAFIRSILKFPKTERVRDVIDRVYNEGGSMTRAVRCRSARELTAYLAVLAEERANQSLKAMLFAYRPPDIEVPQGWKLADKETFWTLGDMFNCCINKNSLYSSRLRSGDAVVAYHSRSIDSDGGALAFFVRGADEWMLSEIRAWSNRSVLSDYGRDADAIGTALSRWERRHKDTHGSELREQRRARDRELRQRAREGGRRDRPLQFVSKNLLSLPRIIRRCRTHLSARSAVLPTRGC